MMKNVFISSKKFFLHFFGHVGKRLVKKAKVNFKTCDIINWDTNNYNKQITQYLRK